jgi:hypothetical protein
MEAATLDQRVKKLKREAAERAMELHDLTEELPGAYARIMDVAKRTYDKHVEFMEARIRLEKTNNEKGG